MNLMLGIAAIMSFKEVLGDINSIATDGKGFSYQIIDIIIHIATTIFCVVAVLQPILIQNGLM